MADPKPHEHRVYTLVQREDDNPYWFQIGRAFPHRDGMGATLRLNALPVSPKLVVRMIDPDSFEAPTGNAPAVLETKPATPKAKPIPATVKPKAT